jgi:hypothetical protein
MAKDVLTTLTLMKVSARQTMGNSAVNEATSAMASAEC